MRKGDSTNGERSTLTTRSAALARLMANGISDQTVIFVARGAAFAVVGTSSDVESTVIMISKVVMTKETVIEHLKSEMKLSARQAEIAYSLVLGTSRSKIAADLEVTIFTVRRHAEAIYTRLLVNAASELETTLSRLVERNLPASPPLSTEI